MKLVMHDWTNWKKVCEISGFFREADENCAILGYYAVCSGNSLPSKERNYHYTHRNSP